MVIEYNGVWYWECLIISTAVLRLLFPGLIADLGLSTFLSSLYFVLVKSHCFPFKIIFSLKSRTRGPKRRVLEEKSPFTQEGCACASGTYDTNFFSTVFLRILVSKSQFPG